MNNTLNVNEIAKSRVSNVQNKGCFCTYYGTLDIDNQNGHTFFCPM